MGTEGLWWMMVIDWYWILILIMRLCLHCYCYCYWGRYKVGYWILILIMRLCLHCYCYCYCDCGGIREDCLLILVDPGTPPCLMLLFCDWSYMYMELFSLFPCLTWTYWAPIYNAHTPIDCFAGWDRLIAPPVYFVFLLSRSFQI